VIDLHDLSQISVKRLRTQPARFTEDLVKIVMIKDEVSELGQDALPSCEFVLACHHRPVLFCCTSPGPHRQECRLHADKLQGGASHNDHHPSAANMF
jgi:hypothetical protein